ncbi:YihY/virulence factor BrkB family protein [Streptomyces chumphonensis]|uniref:YihY/virulence factor BrkB family protein n=1 Tax=Streptomyces chumphonensis TaxID=1214925 RepID=UPI003D73D102
MARHPGDEGEGSGPAPGGSREPADGPTDLSKRSWKGVLKRTGKEFREDNLTDWAAALTYYGVLSVFPALLALVSVLGLIGSSAIQPLIDNVGELAPGAVRDLLTDMLEQLQNRPGAAGFALVAGLLVALWSASGYVAAFMRAANAIYDVREGRPLWKTLPTRLGITVVTVVLLAAISVGVVFTGGLAERAGEVLGLGDTVVTVWNIAKWPVLVLLVALVFSLLYWAAPNVRRRFRWVTPGGLLAVLVWVVASALFALYAADFASYGKTYGSLAAVIVFLVWLWISNIAILLGLELNAELERGRAVESGHPPEEEPYVEPRDTRTFEE